MYVNLCKKKVAVYTLGCKVNQYESDSMQDLLASEGCEVVAFDDAADIYIINTCSVTNMAERKSRQIINRARKRNPSSVVVAAGCYVQAAAEELKNNLAVDILVGNNRKKDMARILDEFLADREPLDTLIDINAEHEYESMHMDKPREHCRAFVKVQDGCNNFCTYCIIPYTRGRIRSRLLSEVVLEVENLGKQGVREIVITGINLSSYSDDEGHDLLDLIQAVSNVDTILRVRMGSLEPRVITDRFLSGISEDKKVCPHFHLSLQSACNETLKRMNRHYTIEEYMETCELIRKYYDRPAITTDVIVGFPGETDEEFETTRANLEKLNLYEMHIFKYSRRKGTLADTMLDQIPDSTKEQRSNILLEMTKRHKEAYENSFSGEEVEILVEEHELKDGVCYMKGHTDRYILVNKEAREGSEVNKIEKVTL